MVKLVEILGIDGLTVDQLNQELDNGAKFVIYQYCISLGIITYRRSSNIYFVRKGESIKQGLPHSLLTVLLGWWGIPWGPIYSISSLVTNFRGGKDVTQQIITHLNRPAPSLPFTQPFKSIQS